MKIFIYEIYKNGVPIRQGTAGELARAFQIHSNKISCYAANDSLIRGKYRIKKVREISKEMMQKRRVEKPREDIVSYFIRHLEEYGNVASPRHLDPSIYLEELEGKGYKCIVSKFKEIDVDDLTPNSHRKNIEYEYTLTRV